MARAVFLLTVLFLVVDAKIIKDTVERKGGRAKFSAETVILNSFTNNALTYNALTNNALTNNALTYNALTYNSLIPNGVDMPNGIDPNSLMINGIPLNGITLNAVTTNALTNNAMAPNGITLNRLVLNSLIGNSWNNGIAPNGLSNDTLCLNVTDFNASGLPGCTNTTTPQNGTLCFNLTQSNVSGPLTSQDLAVLALASVNNNTSNNPTLPLVRLSELGGQALTGENLPANLSLILSGVAGEAAQEAWLQLLNYTVSCALNPNQSVTLPLAPPVVLEGSLGLAQHWTRRSINKADQEAVSACLAARFNFFGVHVLISIRGRGIEPPDASEIAEYNLQEGAFWGNLFAEEPAVFACTNATNLENSYAHLRFCSTGFPVPDGSTISCGPLRHVGSCRTVCEVNPAHRDEFRVCFGFQEVLSVFLPSSAIDSPTARILSAKLVKQTQLTPM